MQKATDAPGIYYYLPGVTKLPRRTQGKEGNWVGVGGPIKVTPEPPALPYVVPEASQEDLHYLFSNGGFDKILTLTPPVAEKENVSPIQKSDSGSTKG